ncbi:MAG: glycosyltransferase family 39 protein [Candidatus Diapherotrites archaeon]
MLKMKSNLDYSKILKTTIIILTFLVLVLSIVRIMDHDEIEHIHSAWYIKEGKIPYKDFFQSHNPLFWYLMAPFVAIYESPNIIFFFRFLMFLSILAIAYFTKKIVEEITDSKEVSYITIILLLTNLAFLHKAIEIRPDVPQTLTSIISIWLMIKYFKTRNNKLLILSGIVLAISFLFLQKAIALFLAIILFLIYLKIVNKELKLKQTLIFSVSFLLPIIFFLGYMIFVGALNDYIIGSWLVNLFFALSFSPLNNIGFFAKNFFVWALMILGLIEIINGKEKNFYLKFLYFVLFILLLTTFFTKTPFLQYFMTAMVIISIIGAYFLAKLYNSFKVKEIYKIIVLFLIISYPLGNIVWSLQKTNFAEIERFEFIKENTTKEDYFFGNGNKMNLFSQDVHYIWFGANSNSNLGTYNKITNGKFSDYNSCKLIEEKKPKFVYWIKTKENNCDIRGLGFEETKYENLYMRKD